MPRTVETIVGSDQARVFLAECRFDVVRKRGEMRLSNRWSLKKGMFLFCLYLSLVACAGQQKPNPMSESLAYNRVKSNIDAVFSGLQFPQTSMPYIEASFCLDRAKEIMKKAWLNQGADNTFLLLAGITGATGVGLLAGAGAMDESDRRTNIAVAAAIVSVLPGAIFGTREAFKTYEVAKAQRIAAARNVDAAFKILERYALADDPRDVVDDGFATCRDGDIDIANSYPGVRASEETKKSSSRQQADAADEQSAQSVAKEKREAVKSAVREKEDAIKEKEAAAAELKKFEKKPAGKLSPAAVAAQDVFEAARKELVAVSNKVDSTQEEAVKAEKIAALKKEIIDLKEEVRMAYSRFRRTVLYLSTSEVKSAQALAEDATTELSETRKKLKDLTKDNGNGSTGVAAGGFQQ